MQKGILISVLLMLLVVPVVASAHSGKTDGSGGHTDHSTGEYHYHHGYSAHSHYDMDGDGVKGCPYDFKDKTNHSSNNNSQSNEDQKSTTKQATANTEKQTETKKIDSDLVGVIVYVIIIALSWAIFIWFCSMTK